MPNCRHALPVPPPRAVSGPVNPHERRFRDMEVALLNLIFDLGITDSGQRRQAMVLATRAVQTLRAELSALAPGKLATGETR